MRDLRLLLVAAVLLVSGCGGGGSTAPAVSDSAPTPPAAPPPGPTANELVEQYAAEVRQMADINNTPIPGSLLEQQMLADGNPTATCVDFALTVLAMLQQDSRFSGQARRVSVALNLDWDADGSVRAGFDVHTLLEVLQDGGRWTLVDPTFGFVPTDNAGNALTAVELSHLARAHDWTGMSFRYLTPAGDAYAQSYYVDYPLLFVNVATNNSMQVLVDPMLSADDLGYFYSLVGYLVSQPGIYVAHCAPGADADSTFGVELPCSSQGFSTAHYAEAGQDQFGIYQLQRFVFIGSG